MLAMGRSSSCRTCTAQSVPAAEEVSDVHVLALSYPLLALHMSHNFCNIPTLTADLSLFDHRHDMACCPGHFFSSCIAAGIERVKSMQKNPAVLLGGCYGTINIFVLPHIPARLCQAIPQQDEPVGLNSPARQTDFVGKTLKFFHVAERSAEEPEASAIWTM